MTSTPVLAPIVEGHGEVVAIRQLVTRVGYELLGTWIEVAQPFRLDSGKMRKPDELAKAIRVQAARVHGYGGVLVLRDGDGVACPVELAALLAPSQGLLPVRVDQTHMYPIVAASFDHGATFPQVSSITLPVSGNWGDRDFIAASRNGDIYLTWNYGPSAVEVKLLCSPAGS